LVRESLNDPEPLVRETAIWALAQLEPEDLNRTLHAHSSDVNPQVRTIVAELLGIEAQPSY
jgi:HEAT repeat protein